MASRSVEQASPAKRVEDQLKAHRRELMAAEFERIALELFAERGFNSVAVEEIAEAAGVSTRTFYRYFPAKEDVLALFPRHLDEIGRGLLEAEPPGRTPFEAIYSVMTQLAEVTDRDYLRRWIAAISADPVPLAPLAQSIAGFEQRVESMLRGRQKKSPNAAARLRLVMAASQAAFSVAATTWYETGGDFAALVRDGLDLLSEGFS